MSRHSWSAPGSALLAGEYRIVEEGGCGIAVACGGRATMSTEVAIAPLFRGVWPEEPLQTASVKKMTDTIRTILSRLPEVSSPPGISVLVDTGAFFDNGGRKRGYGSSAAAALLFTKAMAPDADLKTLTGIAVAAHRMFQDGKGSGYDVLTSAWGGAGVFIGGNSPLWKPTGWPKGVLGWLIKGPFPVKTPDAVAKYTAWTAACPDEHRRITGEMDRTINEMALSTYGDSTLWLEGIKHLAAVGIRLGDLIGVTAMPDNPGGLGKDLMSGKRQGAALKCLGAGNELILLTAFPDGLKKSELQRLNELVGNGAAEKLLVEDDGLREELL